MQAEIKMEQHSNPLISVILGGLFGGITAADLTHSALLSAIGGIIGWMMHQILNVIKAKIKNKKPNEN
jgi:hypothetical protein